MKHTRDKIKRRWSPAVFLFLCLGSMPSFAEDIVPPSLLFPTPSSPFEVRNPQPGFVWSTVTHSSGIAGYQLQVATDASFSNLIVNQSVGSSGADEIGHQLTSPLAYGNYYWRVEARANDGTKGYSLAQLMILKPFTYTYDLQLSSQADLSAPQVFAGFKNTTTVLTGADLFANQTYYWGIKTWSEAITYSPEGNPTFEKSSQSAVFSFYINDNFGPNAPIVVYPSADGHLLNTSATFVWSASVDESAPVVYDIALSDDPTFGTVLSGSNSNITGTSATFSGLTRGLTYYFRVTAKDSLGNATVGQTRAVTIQPKAINYTLVVFDENAGQTHTTQSFLTSPTWTLVDNQELDSGTSYRWWVTAEDSVGQITQSGEFHIAPMNDVFAPNPALLEYPLDGSTMINAKPGFTWIGATDAASYQIEVSSTDDFVSPVLSKNLSTSSYQMEAGDAPLTGGLHYYWRVKSTDITGNTSVSATNSFFLTKREVTYTFEVAVNDPSFSDVILTVPGLTDTTYPFPAGINLPELTNIYWRVTATDQAGLSAVSTSSADPAQNYHTFYMQDYFAPTLPVLQYPLADATVLNPQIDFDWADSFDEGGVSYLMQLSQEETFTGTLIENQSGLSQSSTSLTSSTPLVPGTYYWRVASVDNLNNTSTWVTQSFVVDPGATEYSVLISKGSDSTVSNPFIEIPGIVADSPTATSVSMILNPEVALTENENYYWRVVATDPAGHVSNSSGAPFFFPLADSFAPIGPILSYPRNQEQLLNPRPCFTWEPAIDGDVVTYAIEVSDSDSFSNIIASGTGINNTDRSYCMTADLPSQNTNYYWRVIPTDGNNNSGSSVTHTFYHPSNTSKYQLEVASDAAFSNVVAEQSDIEGTTVTLSDAFALQESTSYYWRVTARSPAGLETVSTGQNTTNPEANFFPLADLFAPQPPVLLYPQHRSEQIATSGHFLWEEVYDSNNPATYQFELSDSPDFSTTLVNVSNLTEPRYSYSGTLTRQTRYYWRVRAVDAAMNVSGNAGAHFDVKPKALSYTFQIGTDANVDSRIYDAEVTSLSHSLVDENILQENTRYYWKVVARDGSGLESTSNIHHFDFEDNYPPIVPVLSYPVNQSEILNDSPCFSWTKAVDSRPVTYKIEVSEDSDFNAIRAELDGITDANRSFCVAGTPLARRSTFYWRVISTESTGLSSTTPVSTFTVQSKDPLYTVEIYNNASLDQSALVVQRAGIDDTTYVLEDVLALEPTQTGTFYYWRVIAQDAVSLTSTSSEVRTFKLDDVFPPSEPILSYPANGKMKNPQGTLVWEPSLDSDPNISYFFSLADNAAGINPIISNPPAQLETHFDLTGLSLLNGTTYYYKIAASDSQGNLVSGTWRPLEIMSRAPTYTLHILDGLTPLLSASGIIENFFEVTDDQLLTDGKTYSWYVTATDSVGLSVNSNVHTMSLADIYPPPLPGLTYPANYSEVINPLAVFDWDTVSDTNGPVTYDFQLATDNTFATPLLSVAGLSESNFSLTAGQELSPGQQYFWRVKVTDALNFSAWTAPQAFELKDTRPTYHLAVHENGFSGPLVFQAQTKETSLTMVDDTIIQDSITYSWNITVVDNGNFSSESANGPFNFALADIYPPPVPELYYPVNYSRLLNPTPTFVWQTVTDTSGVSYGLVVSEFTDLSSPVINVNGLTTSSYSATTPIAGNKTYYWQVTVTDGNNYSAVTPIRIFDAVQKDPRYELQIAEDDGTGDPAQMLATPTLTYSDIVGTTITLPEATSYELREGVDYFWRVLAVDGAGHATPSADGSGDPQIWKFNLADIYAPPHPTLVFPAHNVTVVNPNVDFLWTAVEDFAGNGQTYGLEVSTTSTFSDIALQVSDLSNPYYATSFTERLARGQIYHWRVRVTDGLGNSDVGQSSYFYVGTKQVKYNVEVFRKNDNTVVYRNSDITTTTDTVPDPLAFVEGQEYYWHVEAFDQAGNSSQSSGSTACQTDGRSNCFTLPDVYPPSAAVLTYPASGIVILNDLPGFRWNAAQDPSGASYVIQIASDNTFTEPLIVNEPISETEYQLPVGQELARDTNYYWRVNTVDGLNNTGIGSYQAFGIASKKVTYAVEVASDVGFNAVVRNFTTTQANDPITTTSFQTPLNEYFNEGTEYYWRVKAFDSLDRETLSTEVHSFKIEDFSGSIIPGGLLGTYYDGVAFGTEFLSRIDPVIDFPQVIDGNTQGDFGTGVGPDTFSVRWQGWLKADTDGVYEMHATSDEGQRLYVDGALIVDDWQNHPPTTRIATVSLTAGWHPIVYEYYENNEGAVARLEWKTPDNSTTHVIPSTHLAISGNPSDSEPPSLLDVYVAGASPDVATIHIRADEPVNVTINYGATTSYGFVASSSGALFSHEILLANVPEGDFHYEVRLTDLNGNQTVGHQTIGSNIQACTPTTAQVSPGGIAARYYTGTNFENHAADANETVTAIAFSGDSTAGDAPSQLGVENFSVMWRGLLKVDTSKDYTFYTTSDDGQRLFIDGVKVIDDWVSHLAITRTHTQTLEAQWHPIRYEVFQVNNLYQGKLEWETDSMTRQLISNNSFGFVDEAYYRPVLPSLAVVGPIEATSPSGTPVTLSAPSATDCRDPLPNVTGNAPEAFPLGTNTVTWTAQNRFGDLQQMTQTVIIQDSTGPSVEAGPDLTVACDSPLGDGQTPLERIQLTPPSVTDNGDASPVTWHDAPDVFPLNTPVTVTWSARDNSNNVGTDYYKVTVVETGNLTLDTGPDLIVPEASGGNCALPSDAPGQTSGTRVSLRVPTVRGLCQVSGDITMTHDYPAPGQTSNVVCLPTQDTTINWSATVGSVSGEGSINVKVFTPAFDIVVDSATSGWTNDPQGGSVSVSVDPAGSFTSDGSLSWHYPAIQAPTSITQQDDTFTASFATEGIYCPLNLYILDGNSAPVAATVEPCFGVDRTKPLTNFDFPTSWVSAANPNNGIPVDGSVPDTYPHTFTGEDLEMALTAVDINGSASSGVASISVNLEDLGDTPEVISLAAHSLATDGYPSGYPAIGPMSAVKTGCDQSLQSTKCVSNKLDLGAAVSNPSELPMPFKISIVVADYAGNINSQDYFMKVHDMKVALDAAYNWTKYLHDNTNELSARQHLKNAYDNLQISGNLHFLSPGHSFLLSDQAYSYLVDAQDYGNENTLFIRKYLPRAMKSEVRRIVEVFDDYVWTDWNLFGPAWMQSACNPNEICNYLASPRSSGEFIIRDVDRLNEAYSRVNDADELYRINQYKQAALSARTAHQSVALLFDDRPYNDLFGSGINYVEGNPEAFFSNATIEDLGKAIASTVVNRIDRVDDVPGLSSAIRTPLASVKTRMQTFQTGVADLTANNINNQGMIERIYMTSQLALEDLAQIEANAFDTYEWKTGMSLVLGFVAHYSIYFGETAMTKIISDPESDDMLKVSECRFNRMLTSIEQNRLDEAVALYKDSKCQILDAYNTYYGGGQQVESDQCINPTTYGCPVKSGATHQGGCAVVDQAALVAAGNSAWDPVVDCNYPQ